MRISAIVTILFAACGVTCYAQESYAPPAPPVPTTTSAQTELGPIKGVFYCGEEAAALGVGTTGTDARFCFIITDEFSVSLWYFGAQLLVDVLNAKTTGGTAIKIRFTAERGDARFASSFKEYQAIAQSGFATRSSIILTTLSTCTPWVANSNPACPILGLGLVH